MRITDEQGTYQGWYQPQIGIFTQSAELVSDKIKINQDVMETLRIAGCKTIETATFKGGHAEPYYISFDRFIEGARLEGDELVYNNPEEDYRHIDERAEVRSNLYP
ncbi:MAG: hypothetical protein WC433_06730 [Candidatus Omnitrophota bacterium]